MFSPVKRGTSNGKDFSYLFEPVWASLRVDLEQHCGKNGPVSKVEGVGKDVVQGAQCLLFEMFCDRTDQ